MDECHGLLVTHQDGRVECLDLDCETPDAPRHPWRADCADEPALCDCRDRNQRTRADRQWAA
ncbi:MAG TPA: hypothetical protein VGO92_04575 [Acidimicrobiales bacterium]|jgi:hypothetical protein|nr:hypothetical protein [Acidimicrobiales bacterium]